jgi:type IV secretory pathway protease TraF
MKKNAAVAQVRVSLKDGLTILDLKPGNTATVAEFRQIIKNNGFVSKEVSALARGNVTTDQRTFTVTGTNEQLTLSSPPERTGEDWKIAVRAPAKP